MLYNMLKYKNMLDNNLIINPEDVIKKEARGIYR